MAGRLFLEGFTWHWGLRFLAFDGASRLKFAATKNFRRSGEDHGRFEIVTGVQVCSLFFFGKGKVGSNH